MRIRWRSPDEDHIDAVAITPGTRRHRTPPHLAISSFDRALLTPRFYPIEHRPVRPLPTGQETVSETGWLDDIASLMAAYSSVFEFFEDNVHSK